MKSIHPAFKTKKVLSHVADLIIEHGYDYYTDLSEGDKCELAALLNEVGGSDDEFCFLTEGDNELAAHFRNVLIRPSPTNQESLIETLRDNAIHYYDYTMDALFNYVKDDYKQSRNEWLDHMAKHGDPDKAYDLYRETIS